MVIRRIPILPAVVAVALTSLPARAQDRTSRPELIAPGVLSGTDAWRATLAPDGRTLYTFRRATPGSWTDFRIVVSRREGGAWSAPAPISFSGQASDLYPTISPDGKTMILVSYRPVEGWPENAYLWRSRLVNGRWSVPEFVPELNASGAYHAQPWFRRNGELQFRRSIPGGPRQFQATFSNGAFSPPVEIPFHDLFPALGASLLGVFQAPGDSLMVLEVRRSRQDTDLLLSRREAGGWSDPRAIPGVSTPGIETFPSFSADGRDLYFVRDFRELYRVALAWPADGEAAP